MRAQYFARGHLMKRALQGAILLCGCVPVLAGGFGLLMGTGFLSATADILLNSHFRYLSGLLLMIGLLFWSLVPHIEQRGTAMRLLTAIVFVGGLARLYGVLVGDALTHFVLFALAMELCVTPLLCCWQWRVARFYRP